MITVNGVKRTLEQPLSVTEYLEKNQYIPVQVAIELNDQILARELYGSTILKEGDVMEIVSFMGGGEIFFRYLWNVRRHGEKCADGV